jgi:hypothetical protein
MWNRVSAIRIAFQSSLCECECVCTFLAVGVQKKGREGVGELGAAADAGKRQRRMRWIWCGDGINWFFIALSVMTPKWCFFAHCRHSIGPRCHGDCARQLLPATRTTQRTRANFPSAASLGEKRFFCSHPLSLSLPSVLLAGAPPPPPSDENRLSVSPLNFCNADTGSCPHPPRRANKNLELQNCWNISFTVWMEGGGVLWNHVLSDFSIWQL